MSLPSLLEGIPGISGALTADAGGTLTGATHPDSAQRSAAAAAGALGALAEAGGALGLARLELVTVKGPAGSHVAAVRDGEFMLVAVDVSKGTSQVEKVLHGWVAGASPPDRATHPPQAAAPSPAPTPAPTRTPTPTPTPAPAPAAPAGAGLQREPWVALRRALVRALLIEAAARRRELAEAGPASGRPGSEPLPVADLDRALQLLLQGIGSILAGDGLAGARTLEPLASEAQPNLSVRWLARYWSGRAALKGGDSAAARTHLTQALGLAKQLDAEAVAASQWAAADVLALDGDHRRATACRAAAREGFEQLRDGWGLAQTWLSEARGLVAQRREEEAVAAADRARAADPASEEPPVFLARRAVVRGDLAGAEEQVRHLAGPGAERVRALVEAVRLGAVSAADASEFLVASEAPPTPQSLRAIERVAQAAPRFAQARETLAWMLLKLGKYAEASTIFRGLLAQQLSPADRASVMLGLGCVAHAQQAGRGADARLQAAVAAGEAAPAPAGAADALAPLSASTLSARSSQMSSAASVFSGQLSVFPLPDVIEFVRSARRTGLLVCSSSRGMAAVHFRGGRITGATAPGTPDLGELLVRARKVSSVALRALRSPQARGPQRDHALAAALLREGLVDAASLGEAARRQVELVVLELVSWKEGEFAFNREGDGEPADAPVTAELDAQDVLLTVLTQLDEATRGPAAPGAPR